MSKQKIVLSALKQFEIFSDENYSLIEIYLREILFCSETIWDIIIQFSLVFSLHRFSCLNWYFSFPMLSKKIAQFRKSSPRPFPPEGSPYFRHRTPIAGSWVRTSNQIFIDFWGISWFLILGGTFSKTHCIKLKQTFLAVKNSSLGDLVTHWLTDWLTESQYFYFLHSMIIVLSHVHICSKNCALCILLTVSRASKVRLPLTCFVQTWKVFRIESLAFDIIGCYLCQDL